MAVTFDSNPHVVLAISWLRQFAKYRLMIKRFYLFSNERYVFWGFGLITAGGLVRNLLQRSCFFRRHSCATGSRRNITS